ERLIQIGSRDGHRGLLPDGALCENVAGRAPGSASSAPFMRRRLARALSLLRQRAPPPLFQVGVNQYDNTMLSAALRDGVPCRLATQHAHWLRGIKPHRADASN